MEAPLLHPVANDPHYGHFVFDVDFNSGKTLVFHVSFFTFQTRYKKYGTMATGWAYVKGKNQKHKLSGISYLHPKDDPTPEKGIREAFSHLVDNFMGRSKDVKKLRRAIWIAFEGTAIAMYADDRMGWYCGHLVQVDHSHVGSRHWRDRFAGREQ